MKTPYTPTTSISMKAKNPFTLSSRSHIVSTPVKKTMEFSMTRMVLKPSTPR